MSDLDLFAVVANTFINTFGGEAIVGLIILGIVAWFAIQTRLDRTALVFLGIMFSWTMMRAEYIEPIIFWLVMIVAGVFLFLGLFRGGGGE